MTPAQIARLMATEHKTTHDPRREWWHYRRTPATADRDAIWQYADRTTDTPWAVVPIPSIEVLARLVPKGAATDGRLRWQGFHDPAEYAKGN